MRKPKIIASSWSNRTEYWRSSSDTRVYHRKWKMNGVGNVTNLETWIDTFKSPAIAYGVGQGILTTKDKQRATWIAQDIGRTNGNNGAIIYHGVMFFSSNSTGKLAFVNNLEGLYITEVNGSKQKTKMWEWK